MIDYLKKYNLTDDDINLLNSQLSEDIKNSLFVMKDNAETILNYLKELGVTNFKDLLLERIDICFFDLNYLKEKIEKYDKKLIKFVIDNSVGDLLDFDI
ncbi:MAG: hypothetical protein Q4C44_03725 [bacterium]|nr:hypothetical protein [bacterium]